MTGLDPESSILFDMHDLIVSRYMDAAYEDVADRLPELLEITPPDWSGIVPGWPRACPAPGAGSRQAASERGGAGGLPMAVFLARWRINSVSAMATAGLRGPRLAARRNQRYGVCRALEAEIRMSEVERRIREVRVAREGRFGMLQADVRCDRSGTHGATPRGAPWRGRSARFRAVGLERADGMRRSVLFIRGDRVASLVRRAPCAEHRCLCRELQQPDLRLRDSIV